MQTTEVASHHPRGQPSADSSIPANPIRRSRSRRPRLAQPDHSPDAGEAAAQASSPPPLPRRVNPKTSRLHEAPKETRIAAAAPMPKARNSQAVASLALRRTALKTGWWPMEKNTCTDGEFRRTVRGRREICRSAREQSNAQGADLAGRDVRNRALRGPRSSYRLSLVRQGAARGPGKFAGAAGSRSLVEADDAGRETAGDEEPVAIAFDGMLWLDLKPVISSLFPVLSEVWSAAVSGELMTRRPC